MTDSTKDLDIKLAARHATRRLKEFKIALSGMNKANQNLKNVRQKHCQHTYPTAHEGLTFTHYACEICGKKWEQ